MGATNSAEKVNFRKVFIFMVIALLLRALYFPDDEGQSQSSPENRNLYLAFRYARQLVTVVSPRFNMTALKHAIRYLVFGYSSQPGRWDRNELKLCDWIVTTIFGHTPIKRPREPSIVNEFDEIQDVLDDAVLDHLLVFLRTGGLVTADRVGFISP